MQSALLQKNHSLKLGLPLANNGGNSYNSFLIAPSTEALVTNTANKEIRGESVSVVIATYNRPDTLHVALQSVALQRRKPEEVLVVGDYCDRPTGDVVAAMTLPGLRYINLPIRCGEQAIPNAVGTALARGRWIAYLNHDDVWAPDYLGIALDALAESGCRWFVGHSYFSYGSDAASPDEAPVFTDRTPASRKMELAFSKSAMYVEPVSAWLVEKALALEIGNWRPAWSLRRTPTADFALRLFRAAGEPSTSVQPTVFKLPSAVTGSGSLSYKGTSTLHAQLGRLMEIYGTSFVRHLRVEEGKNINREADLQWGVPDPKRWPGLHRWLRHQDRHALYSLAGIDCPQISAMLLGFAKGAHLRRALKGRTGEENLARHDPHRIIETVSPNYNQ
jgi:glycosyltransferase involved in cell wall biosynthesis